MSKQSIHCWLSYFNYGSREYLLPQARDWITITSPFMSREKTYLAIVSSDRSPGIFAWDRDYSKKFAKVQNIPSERTRDMVFFNMGESVYLAVASHRSTDIYQGSTKVEK